MCSTARIAGTAPCSGAGLALERLRVRIPGRGDWRKKISPELTLSADSYSISVPTPVLPGWYVKDPGHSAESAGWQVTPNHTYTLVPTKSEWADYAAVQA